MKNFTDKIQIQLNIMMATGMLFRSSMSGQEIWDMYLNAFSEGDDPVFRDPESSEHNCNHCKNFIRRYGNIVAVIDNKIVTMFDVDITGEYRPFVDTVSAKLKNTLIQEVFFETFNELNSLPYESCNRNSSNFQLGVDKNVKRYTKEEAELYGVVKPDEIKTFNHFFTRIDAAFVDKSGSSIESIMAKHRDNKNVFQRTMVEIPLDTLELVRDLINQGSLLDGEAHVYKINAIIPLKKEYIDVPASQRDAWLWVKSRDFQFAKFKNELIGVLCSELAEGEELNKAVQAWNKRVDPANYMKAVAPFTQRQKDAAAAFVTDNGYTESFNRRLAILDDIKASEIKHINSGEGEIAEVSMFDNLKTTAPNRHKRNQFDGVEEVGIEKFMSDILPSCTSIEAYLENKHENNMVTMTTSKVENSKPMFKWDNNYSWTYNGNLAGKSQIKEAVKSQGGGVDGILRFSMLWSEGDGDNSDLDAHCIEPTGNLIYFSSKRSNTGGVLDIDIQNPLSHRGDVVENITWPTLNRMPDGEYTFLVHQYSASKSQGFRAEIEFDGEIYSYTYPNPVSGKVKVATVTKKGDQFTIVHHLQETNSSKEIYGLETKNFHKVNLACLSPNHWGSNQAGNKHYFFMLDKCKAQSDIRGYHIENFNPELVEHRKVLEPLASTIMISPEGNQLSGLGFNATVRDELILKLGGNFKRIIKLKF